VGLGGLSIANLEKLGYYKVSKQEFGMDQFRGVTKGKDQLVGYGKQLKMIFSPSTGAYKQVGGFKAIFDIFPSMELGTFLDHHGIIIDNAWVMNLLPIQHLMVVM
jgi:regulator of sigma E protease